MSNLKAFPDLFIEDIEINRLISLLEERGFRKLLSKLSFSYGVVRKGSLESFNDLKIYESSANKVGIKAGSSFDSAGNLVNLDADVADILTIPDDNTYYKIFITYAQSQIELGTVQLLTDGSIIGTNTEFDKIFNPGKSIEIINSTQGNDGIYEVVAVNSATDIDTNETFVAESGLHFKVVGVFTPGATIPDGNKRPYFYDSYILSLESDANSATNTKFLLARIKNNGGTLTLEDKRLTNLHEFKDFYGAYTNSPTFRVGGANGRYVLLANDAPPNLLNLRIIDVNGVSIKYVEEEGQIGWLSQSIKESIVNKGKTYNSNSLKVKIKWGYDDITGTGGDSSFTINNAGYSFSNGVLDNLYFWIPSLSKNLLITTNTGNVLSVTEIDGSAIDLTGLVVQSGSNTAWIHFNANEYEIMAIPVKDDVQYYNSVIDRYAYTGTPVKMEIDLNLEMGVKYYIKCRSKNGEVFSNWYEMPAGSYTKYNTTQNYSKPFLAIHPQISSTGASISAVATKNGFDLVINGWNEAEAFEVCWTTDQSGADFSNSAHLKRIILEKIISITTNLSYQFHIAVRPLVSSQQVAPALSTTVVSGSSGIGPEDRAIVKRDINIVTYSGKGTYNTSSPGVLTSITNLKSPAGSSNAITEIPSTIIGKVITIGTYDYMIVSKNSSNSITFESLNNAPLPSSSGTKTFTISTSYRGRRISMNELTQDHNLTRFEIDSDFINGNVNVRVFQLGRATEIDSGNADNIIVNQNDKLFSTFSDIEIGYRYGNRTIVVDAWDINGLLNNNNLVGSITIYGTPVTRIYDPRLYSNP